VLVLACGGDDSDGEGAADGGAAGAGAHAGAGAGGSGRDAGEAGESAAGAGGRGGGGGRSGAGAGGSAGARAGGSGAGGAGAGAGAGGAAGGGEAAAQDFAARCDAKGVLVCRGFDAESELSPVSLETETGAENDNTGSREHLVIDGDVKVSGEGALRFEIAGRTAANHSGAFRQLIGRAFGPGTSFYVQFRLRLSSEFVSIPWDAVVGSSPKIVIFHHHSATCNDIEWTQVMNGWYDHIATMYTHCGQYAPGQDDDPITMQQGDYDCVYGTDYANDPECFKYPPDKWLTFYFKGTMGAWGEPTSHLEAWVAQDGGPYEQWIDEPDFTLHAEDESVEGFDSVYLTTYMTNKDASADHATAYAWYDELIVSSEPIAPPAL
jgi:hypothetical protein